jgi:hypothetical protein
MQTGLLAVPSNPQGHVSLSNLKSMANFLSLILMQETAQGHSLHLYVEGSLQQQEQLVGDQLQIKFPESL